MLVEATPAQADAILRAMKAVATADGKEPFSDADRTAVAAARHYVFRRLDEIDVATLEPISPSQLAEAVADAGLRNHAVSFLAVMSTVDGSIDRDKIDVVLAYAKALGVDDEVVHELAAVAAGQLQWALADMTRQNMTSVTHHDWSGDANAWLQPYDQAPDPSLAARYVALRDLPTGSFGRAFHDFYTATGFAFAGTPGALNERFATPHDSTHVLSGYSTTPQGELLVSTFTAGMHPHEPVSGHILPVIYSFHLGVTINDIAKRFTDALQPEKFWVAWTRGSALTADTFDPDWDFWAITTEPLDRLRERYEVPPLDPAMAADDTPPAWYKPIA